VLAHVQPTRCAAGVLALRVPDPPAYAPPSVAAISKDGKIVAVSDSMPASPARSEWALGAACV
jgi:hypothetical protein